MLRSHLLYSIIQSGSILLRIPFCGTRVNSNSLIFLLFGPCWQKIWDSLSTFLTTSFFYSSLPGHKPIQLLLVKATFEIGKLSCPGYILAVYPLNCNLYLGQVSLLQTSDTRNGDLAFPPRNVAILLGNQSLSKSWNTNAQQKNITFQKRGIQLSLSPVSAHSRK